MKKTLISYLRVDFTETCDEFSENDIQEAR